MQSFNSHKGKVVAIDRSNIDTDQIIPKQFLKRIERTGYGQFLFYDWRFDVAGNPQEDFILNDPRYGEASILIAGENFGCGSSREHAPWSLMDYGFRAVIAPSFADIFYNNSLKNGLLPVVLTNSQVAELCSKSIADPDYTLEIDLVTQTVTDADGFNASFSLDPFRKHCLLEGLDDIGLTLQFEDKIAEYEARVAAAS
ncbi:MAG TPA: 3-isopropylmalate dehydratase small subunit [Pyrinomonadaceae bacterium]|nr:3-isopropylmalate dehydratase small subunit [Pyrinomonadaceae bacterium]